jgi:hypothetical protein
MSPARAPKREYPRTAVIRSAKSSAMRVLCIPGSRGRAENPHPGSDGATTSNESAASPPYDAGSVRSGTTFVIS